MQSRRLCIYILCGNAAYNRGDRGNLLSQIAMLSKQFPGAQIVGDSFRPQVDAAWFGIHFIKRGFFLTLEQIRWLRRADVVVWGGGALLADNSCRVLIPQWFAIIAFVRLVLRKPIMAWAQGIVLETWLGKYLARFALNWVDIISVRDRNSAEALEKLALVLPVEQTADPAILICPADKATGMALLERCGIPLDKPIIAMCPTFWHLYHDKHSILPYPMGKRFSRTLRRNADRLQRYKHGMATLSAELVRRHDARVLLIPRYPHSAWDDEHYCSEIKHASGCGDRVLVWQDDTAAPKDFFALWRCFEMVVSVAMHDAIFACAAGTPVLHLYYEPKGKDFFEDLGVPGLMMPWDRLLETEGVTEIVARAIHIWDQRQKIAAQLSDCMAPLRIRAERNLVLLQELLRSRGFV